MIDTLMAFWNQNRRRRAAQVLLTFFLMCISISLLFVAISLPQWSHTHPQGSVTGRAGDKGNIGVGVGTTPTVIVQITQGPETKPTTTVVVPDQITPTPAGGTYSCTTPDAQVNANTTAYSNTASPQVTAKIANTPVSQRPSPVTHKAVTPTPGTQAGTSTTPSATAIATPTTQPTITADATATGTPISTQPVTPTATGTATISLTMTSTVSPTPTSTDTGTGGTPLKMPAQEQSGGGPINSGTPVSASPVPGITPTGTTQHIGGGWLSPCNSNDIGMATGANVVIILWQHMWLIIGASLFCTALFYGIVRVLRV